MVRVFETFAAERQLRRLVSNLIIESAATYRPSPSDADYLRKNDVPWIRRFADAGGQAIICNDHRMMKVPHERTALVEANLVVVFFERSWNQLPFTAKCAHMLLWWERIVSTIQHSSAPAFWKVPQKWELDEKLQRIPHDDVAKQRIERQLAEQPKKRAARAQRRKEAPTPLLDWNKRPKDESRD